MTATSSRKPRYARLLILVGIVLLASLIAWRLGYFDLDRREQLAAARRAAAGSMFAAPLFIGGWTLAVLLCLPTTILTIVGGALFGPIRGALFAWSGALIGTTIGHFIASSVGRSTINRLFGRHRLLERLRGRTDLRTLIPLRVLPIAPFGVFTYVAGIARIPRRSILLATGLGMIPSMVGYAFAGDQLRRGIESQGADASRALFIAGAVSLVVSGLAVIPWIVRRIQRRKA